MRLKASIRDDHPRVFLNDERLPAVRERARTDEKALFEELRAATIPHEQEIKLDDHGKPAATAAFLFQITGEDRYRDVGLELLATSLEYYRHCYEQGQSVSWFSFSRICAIAAYDWLFESISEDRRREMGMSLLRAIERVQPTDDRNSFRRENWGDYASGFYGTPSLLWYAGLATYDEGIDDELAAEFVDEGYDHYINLLEYREVVGTESGVSTPVLDYAIDNYPWAEFSFFHSLEAATGESIASDWSYVANLPGFLFWNWLPGAKEFGVGDAHHADNRLRLRSIHSHLTQIEHFYGVERPNAVALAKWLQERVPREYHHADSSLPFIRFLATNASSGVDPASPPADLPYAKRYPLLGQTLFRSGWHPGDTYATVSAGGKGSHDHYDANHFAIFKDGYLALDSGTRPNPSYHLSHYYPRTVAHNCVLIRMPDEELPSGWGAPNDGNSVPVPNAGGQRRKGHDASEVVASERTDEYAYVAGDATNAYHEKKCNLALRQFVFLPPDHFVVFDRVTSTVADYPKTWLLHTATEPVVDDNGFAVDHETGLGNRYPSGRLWGRTLLPRDAGLSTTGGEGAQFQADGRNWGLPDHFGVPEETPLFGQWRLEVCPSTSRKTDYFLHLLRVGSSHDENWTPQKQDLDPAAIDDHDLIETGDTAGVQFHDGDREWRLTFATEGPASGNIRLLDDDASFNRSLAEEDDPQGGLF